MKRFALVSFCFCLFLPTGLACRYTVRDSGFVDTGTSLWRLKLLGDSKTEQELALALKMHGDLLNSNLRVKVMSGESGLTRYPAYQFISPEGKAWFLPTPEGDLSIKEEVSRVIQGVLSSPAREKLLENLIHPLCVVLIVEGADKKMNEIAGQAAAGAMERITPLLPLMDKPVDTPPVTLTISLEERKKEAILLRCLGIEDEDKTHAMVLFGRGRRIGPLLTDETITPNALYNIFQVVGTDCECDLHPIWFSGIMIPLIWDEEKQAQAAERLGFDPENPMVMLEVSRILSRGGFGPGRNREEEDPYENDILFGYQEEVIRFEDTEDEAPETEPVIPEKEEPPPSSMMNTYLITAVLTGCILLIGLVILIRGAKGR